MYISEDLIYYLVIFLNAPVRVANFLLSLRIELIFASIEKINSSFTINCICWIFLSIIQYFPWVRYLMLFLTCLPFPILFYLG